MKVPIEWLKEFVEFKMRPDELAQKLTMAGVEVGAIEYHGGGIKGVIVGKIKSIERLADYLVCQVDIGVRILQIMSNDQTLQVGDRVPVAQDNSTLVEGIKIKKISLHGVESFGMLCRPHELGLGGAEHVLKLPLQAKIGDDVRTILGKGEVVMDLDVLPNRQDLQSIIGVAREVGAILKSKIPSSKFQIKEGEEKDLNISIEVKDQKLCPRYMTRFIEGVKIKESPAWMKDRLLMCGLRPINNIVDATNYVLLEYGQPLHAFDAKKVDKIVVRSAMKGEKIKTIDANIRNLDPSMLVIADSKKPIAVAGIMGGIETEVSNDTVNIILESAYFDPISINKTSHTLKLRSESSVRFGKGVDWEGVENALDRAAGLIAEFSEGKVWRGKIDIKAEDKKQKTIDLRLERVNQILGCDLEFSEVKKILERLNFEVNEREGQEFLVSVPFFRAGDVEREIDLIEEIARIYGYDKIDSTLPRVSQEIENHEVDRLCQKTREIMVGAGLYEVQTFSILDPKYSKRLNLAEEYLRNCIKIANPLTEEESVLRTLLVPSLLKAVDYNFRHQVEDIRIFEIGKVFQQDDQGKTIEKLMLGGALTFKGLDFLNIKGIVEVFFSEFGILKIQSIHNNFLHPGKSAGIILEGKAVGFMGEIHPDVMKKYEFPAPVYVFEINLELLLKNISRTKVFKALPRFPKTDRDVAMFIKDGVTHEEILETIENSGGCWVEDVQLFDIFKNSRAYRVTYRDNNRTLTIEEVNAKHEEICKSLTAKLGVELRR